MLDYHLHTNNSLDGFDSMEDMIRAAADLGLSEMMITDHADYSSRRSRPFVIDYPPYIEEYRRLSAKYADRITVLLGAEVSIGSNIFKQNNEFVKKYPFEFVIGSVHGILGSELYMDGYFPGRTKDEAYTLYFEEMLRAVKVSDFDVLGHMDFIPRYAPYEDRDLNYEDYQNIIDAILEHLIKTGRGIEINASGFGYGLGKLHPQQEILNAYKRLGGEIITIGSDSHKTKDIARYYAECEESARKAGFTKIYRYRNRKPI